MPQYSIYGPWAGEPWGAFDELRREMDALLGRFSPAGPRGRQGLFPATNIYESDDAYVLTAELPGVRSEDIEVSLEGSTVTLRGERRIDYADPGLSVHRLERRSGPFRRAVDLPVPVDADKVEAVHRNGVLMLRLPKSPEQKPRQISVKAS